MMIPPGCVCVCDDGNDYALSHAAHSYVVCARVLRTTYMARSAKHTCTHARAALTRMWFFGGSLCPFLSAHAHACFSIAHISIAHTHCREHTHMLAHTSAYAYAYAPHASPVSAFFVVFFFSGACVCCARTYACVRVRASACECECVCACERFWV